MAQPAGTVEYTDYITAKGQDSHNEYPYYDAKRSDGEAQGLELWGI